MKTSKNTECVESLNREIEKEKALAQIKTVSKSVTIEDLEAKLKKLGLDTDLFVRKVIRDPDKGWKYIIHDIDWYPVNRAVFESYSPLAVSRTLTKIYKERQLATEAVDLEIVKVQLPQSTISHRFTK